MIVLVVLPAFTETALMGAERTRVIMSTFQETSNRKAAGAAPETGMLSPANVMAQLRSMQEQIPEIAPLTPQERKALRNNARVPSDIMEASISVIGASDAVVQGVGASAEGVQQWLTDAREWGEVGRQLKAMLKGVDDANLVRRQRAGLAAARAYLIGQQVARDPNNAELRPHVEEVKRLRALARRKRATATPEAPPTDSTPNVAG